jgi:hypothetical protein
MLKQFVRWIKRVFTGWPQHAETVFYVVAAIGVVVGGFFTLCQFEYAEWIKPTYVESPSVVVFGTIRKIGEDNGYVILGYRINITNTRDTDATIVALAITANGHQFTKLDVPRGWLNKPNENYSRYGRDDNITPIFRKVVLTDFAVLGNAEGLTLMPKETYPVTGRFLVKAHTYSLVALFVSVGYVRNAKPGEAPTKAKFIGKNITLYSGKSDPNYKHLDTVVDEITP